MLALTAFFTRRLALGLLIESVGGNAEASRLSGIRSRGILIVVYAFCALCAGIAGLMISSNVVRAPTATTPACGSSSTPSSPSSSAAPPWPEAVSP